MRYTLRVNKRFKYVKVVKINKRIHDNTNALSKAVAKFIDKYVAKRKTGI